MAKEKIEFICTECGAKHLKWAGQCLDCRSWNTLVENIIDSTKPTILQDLTMSSVQLLSEVQTQKHSRISTGISELDRTLGGGLVNGSVVLIGGDPGIGKSTLILQTLANITKQYDTLYVSGEESKQQISSRAQRLKISNDVLLFSETNLEKIITQAKKIKPKVIVIDSIQTIVSANSNSSAGSVTQVRDCAAILTNFAKQSNTILLMIGHVTKGGALAGPRVLEHIVDCVLYFEGDNGGRYRIVRSVKNRFGAVNEISVFAMMEAGLKQVLNPSAIFLSSQTTNATGRVVMVVREGTRSMLIEVQALVDDAAGSPARVCIGLEQNRLILQLAILHKHGEVATIDKNVFVNVVGGVKVVDTASDLAVIMAIFSSITDKIISSDVVIFGEVGLTGEVRPVYNAEGRISEAQKQGFKIAIIPYLNNPKKSIKNIKIMPVKYLYEAIEIIKTL